MNRTTTVLVDLVTERLTGSEPPAAAGIMRRPTADFISRRSSSGDSRWFVQQRLITPALLTNPPLGAGSRSEARREAQVWESGQA
jgi:hypothetical protein